MYTNKLNKTGSTAIVGLMLAFTTACGDEEPKDSADTGFDSGTETTPPDDTDVDPTTDTAPTGPTGDTAITPALTMPIAGAYTDSFGSTHTITNESWTMQFGDYSPSVHYFVEIDASGQWATAENDANNAYSAGLFSRFDWTESEQSLFFCQTAFAAASADEAKNTTAADANNLDTGCGGFPWSPLLP